MGRLRYIQSARHVRFTPFEPHIWLKAVFMVQMTLFALFDWLILIRARLLIGCATCAVAATFVRSSSRWKSGSACVVRDALG
jgi:hypothetical protein